MKVLLIGGTGFIGRHVVEAALACGHAVTLFSRGKTNPELFPQVAKLHGDRDGGLAVLAGQTWDAVIDTCGYLPRVVGASARFLAGAVGHYTYISSMSVYAREDVPFDDETAELVTLADPTAEDPSDEFYGGLKALCEQAVLAALPEKALIVRPGIVVGPYDPSDRYTYWPERISRGGEVLAPAAQTRPIHYIDVRDLAGWVLRMAEAGGTGIYNVTGPQRHHTFGDLIAACQKAAGSPARITWVPEEFLLAQGVEPWLELPLWVPSTMPVYLPRSIDKALAAGLTFRPAEVTAADTLRWAVSRPAEVRRRTGLTPEREAELLRAWHASRIRPIP